MMIAAVATLLAAVLGYYLWWRFSELARARGQKRKLHGRNFLPSPYRLLPKWLGFFGGHTLLIDSEQIPQQLEGWADEFGGDYELDVFGVRMVVVTGLADIRSMLTLRPSAFKRDVSSIGERLCAKLGEQADAEEIVDAKEMLDRFNHDVISLGLFGMDVDSLQASKDRPCPSYEAMRSAMEAMTDIITKPGKMLGWMTLSSMLPWVRRAKEHSAQARDFFQIRHPKRRRDFCPFNDWGGWGCRKFIPVLAAIEATCEANQREGGAMGKNIEADFLVDGKGASHAGYSGTFIRKMMKVTQNEKESGVNTGSDRMKFAHDEIFPHMKGIFAAGTETTSLAISWALYYLTKHPKKFARCRKEALRAAPTRWIDAEREAVLVGEGNSSGEDSVRHQPDAFLGFGAGPRVCPGQSLAMMDGVAILAAIAAQFDTSMAPGQPDPPEEISKLLAEPRQLYLVFKRKAEA